MAGYSQHFFSPEVTNDSRSNLFSLIPEGTRVLDVGCATGNFGVALQNLKGCTVVGVDIDADDVIEAATKGNVDVSFNDIGCLDAYDLSAAHSVRSRTPRLPSIIPQAA